MPYSARECRPFLCEHNVRDLPEPPFLDAFTIYKKLIRCRALSSTRKLNPIVEKEGRGDGEDQQRCLALMTEAQ